MPAWVGGPGARARTEAAQPASPAEARPCPRRSTRAEAVAWRCPFKKGGGRRQRAQEMSRRRPERAAPARASQALARRAPYKPQARPGERRPTATAGADGQGPAGRASRPAHAAEGDESSPTWRCVGLWRAPADARSRRRPPTPRGQPLRQGPQGSAAAARGKGEAAYATPAAPG